MSKGSLNSYCLLKMRMKEVEKLNRKKIQTEASKSDQNSSTKEPMPDVIILDESEYKQKETPPGNQKGTSSGNQKGTPPCNMKGNPPDTKKQKADPSVPVFIYGDFYCALCDAHMNSEDMWNSHIIGKRHMKNLKKGDGDSKYDDLDVESSIKYELRNVKDAIVGLSYIQETRKREVGVPPLYTCFLCQSNFATSPMVIEHLISMKHRLNYIKENSPDDYQLLDATNLKKPQLEPLVTEMAVKLEEKFGSGTVKVKQEKVKLPYLPSKRPIGGGDAVVDRAPKSQKRSDIWKPVSFPENNFPKNVKDCRIIIEERRKRSAISVEEADVRKQRQPFPNHSKKHRSPSPYSRESYKRERTYSRDSLSSEEDYKSYSRVTSIQAEMPTQRKTSHSPSQEPPRNKAYSSRKVVYSSPSDEFHSRSSKLEQKDFSSSKMNYSFPETESQQPDSDTDVLRNFCLKLYALPAELFFKLGNLKMKESMQINGVNDLGALVKVINKAQAVFCKNFPSDLQAIVNEKMLRKTESSHLKTIASPNGNIQTAISSSKKNADLSFLSELINQAKARDLQPPVSSNVASHPNAPPYPGSLQGSINSLTPYSYTPSSNDSYSYSSASSSMAPPAIPALTTGHRQPYSAYNTQQSHYSDPSSSNNYPEYKYF